MSQFVFLCSVVICGVILTVIFFSPIDRSEFIIAESLDIHIDKSIQLEKVSEKKALYIYKRKHWLFLQKIKKMLHSSKNRRATVFYSMKKVKNFTASAPGTDYNHHIVNSYLVGYIPFRTNNIWIPWLTLAKKKTYQTDMMTHQGRNDVWQTSRQSYKYTRGDCEDHAISLADWLIGMGHDARVVIGMYKGGGHAWVVLLKDGKEYLLEATRKSGIKKMGKFPLAKHQDGYRPMYMFNRTQFWQNTGSSLTVNYTSAKWKRKSKYILGRTI